MPIVTVQRRMMELGRVRLGEKGPKGEPRKLATFRFTSASRDKLEAVAAKWGGKVEAWEGAPEEGYWQVTTETAEIPIVLPPIYSDADGAPTVPYSQWFELWSGGGCQRRCDGETEAFSGKPCLCDPDKRACKPTTRVSFMLPDIPGLGVWRLDSHGYYATVELPGTLEVLTAAAHAGTLIDATLRIDHRTKKVPGEGTRRFIVPVIELPMTIKQLAAGEMPRAINAPAPNPGKPELPVTTQEPESEPFENDETPDFGQRPELPTQTPDPLDAASFKQNCLDHSIAPDVVKAKTAELFPGKTRLTNAERGELWAALSTERVPA